MRVKNEEPYIQRALESLAPLGGEIIVLDDGSTDATPKIVRGFSAVRYYRQDNLPMDEGRDRTFLLQRALELGPKWIFTLDGDEELASGSVERVLRAMTLAPPEVNSFTFYLAMMWGKDRFFPGAKIWSMDRMFRVSALDDRDFKFVSPFHCNLHCGCVPKTLRDFNSVKLNAFIKYWGHESVEACEKKIAFYEKHDPINYKNTAKMFRKLYKKAPQTWRDDIDARSHGLGYSVTY